MAEFQDAHTQFLDQLSNEEKKQFVIVKDYAAFLTALANLGNFRKSNKRWSKLLGSVERCGNHLEPYFDVVGTLVQSHPEIAALAWGSFRLVLLLASNYGTFFDKLSYLLEELSKRIPAYDELSKLLEKLKLEVHVSNEFSKSLRAFYFDLFEILKSITRLFTEQNGTILKSEIELLHLKASVKSLDKETMILDNQTTMQHYQADIEKHLKGYNLTLSDMQKRFSGHEHEFANTFEWNNQKRQEGTAEWIFHTNEYTSWLKASSTIWSMKHMAHFLWVRGQFMGDYIDREANSQGVGNPGTGKSVLAASVVQQLLESVGSNQGYNPLITYYFFEHDSENGKSASCDKAYRSILAQIFHQFQDDRDVLEVFSFAINTKSRHGQPIATKKELLDTMRTLVSRVGIWFVVIDALDECEDEENLLSDLAEAFGDLSVKILLFSRPNVRVLRKRLEPQQILTIDRLRNAEDLEVYFETHLTSLIDLGVLPSSADNEQLTRNLLKGADGMFQWARLMISHLKSEGLSPWQRLGIIEGLTTPEKLEDVYVRSLGLLSKKAPSERSLARKLFGWLTFAEHPITTHELQDILTPSPDKAPDNSLGICPRPEEEEFSDFEGTTIILSGSLIEKRSFPNSLPIYAFIHKSVHDFFRSRCGALTATPVDYFLPSSFRIHAELAFQCLSYIRYRIPGAPLSGNMFKPAQISALNRLRPFVSYAALHWPYHLSQTSNLAALSDINHFVGCQDVIEDTLSVIGNFLLNKLLPMVWVELKYTFEKESRKHDVLHKAMIDWALWIQTCELGWLSNDLQNVPPAVIAFTEDLSTLHQFWGDTLIDGPHHIWQDVTAFTSSSFFVTTGAVTVESLVSARTGWSGRSTVPLSKISRDDPNTNFLAILTIWPSRAFEIHWKASISTRKRRLTDGIFDGWVAQYELWNIGFDEPLLVEDCRIPLDETEVQSQYTRFQKFITTESTLNGTGKKIKDLALHFPSSISEDLRTIIVLVSAFDRHEEFPSGKSTEHWSDAAEIWTPTRIPIRHTTNATLLMGISTRTSVEGDAARKETEPPTCTKEKAIRLARTSAYRLTPCRNYALYQTLEGSGILGEEEDITGTIAVYRRHPIHHNSPKLIGCIAGDGSMGSIYRPVFHPTYPLLAFNYFSQIGGSHIVLWSFETGTGDILLLNHDVFSSKSLTGGLSVCYVAALSSRIKMLQFSACGTNVIYQVHNSPSLHTKSITSLDVYNAAKQKNALEEAEEFSQIPQKGGLEDSAVEQIHSLPRSMTLNKPTQNTDGSVTNVSFDVGAPNRAIRLVHFAKNQNYEQSLLSLPAWADVHNVSASVRMPSLSRDERITIILNKTAEAFYVFGRGTGATNPAVVRKDVRALAKPRPISLAWDDGNSSTASSAIWQGITSKSNVSVEEAPQINKRARIE
ncbi:hypothetical protein DDE83_008718 [Stemphylium lycopersici]|uniref:NACHT domain-containing protein n=1 Tax=Stemphylium lycopersici TaxID=183478 RepID=A0A364MSG1_STELY|nr:hypothetical protein DDE83_008718 [Stemphylium lycopersici]